MEKAQMLAAVIGPIYLIFGLSILLYVKQWKKVIAEFSKNHFQMLMGAWMALVLGLIIINMYNVWDWSINVVITLTGWGALLKGIFYLLAPEAWIKGVLKSGMYKSDGMLYFWGAVLVVLGVLLSKVGYFVA